MSKLNALLHGAEHHRAYLYRIVRVVALALIAGGAVTHSAAGYAVSIVAAVLGVPNEFAIANSSTRKIAKPTLMPLGRVKRQDPRSKNFPARTLDMVVSRTWSHYGLPLDQGPVGSCTGNAMAQALNTKPLHRIGARLLVEADALSLYSAAEVIDGGAGYPSEDQGSSGLSVAKAAKTAGLISAYSHAFGLDHVLGALMVGPLMVGVDWTQDMFTPDSKGFVHPTGAVAGGHEFLLLGVDVKKQRLTFLNSWGTGWGRKGRFYMSYADFSTLLGQGGDAVAPRP